MDDIFIYRTIGGGRAEILMWDTKKYDYRPYRNEPKGEFLAICNRVDDLNSLHHMGQSQIRVNSEK